MIKNPFKGKFVVFEGIDLSGKSEQYVRTRNILQANFPEFDAIYLKEPINPEIYQILNRKHPFYDLSEMHPFEFQCWYFTDRVLDYKRNILPALERGESIVMDRGPLSAVFGATEVKEIRHLMEMQNQFFLAAEIPFIWPDANIIIDIPINVFIERATKINKPRDQFENLPEKQRQVRDNYIFSAAEYPNCFIVDGNCEQKVIFDKVWEMLCKVLPL